MRVSRLQDLGLLRVWGAVSRPPDTCAEYVCKAGSKETVCIQIYINIYVYIYRGLTTSAGDCISSTQHSLHEASGFAAAVILLASFLVLYATILGVYGSRVRSFGGLQSRVLGVGWFRV